MGKSKQPKKYNMAMTGEYAVASQLHRLGISASVTYGNAKKVDIVAFNELAKKFTLIEVKSSDKGAWRVGSRVPEPSETNNVLAPASFKVFNFIVLPPITVFCPDSPTVKVVVPPSGSNVST